jgi:prevent-host-death family protein
MAMTVNVHEAKSRLSELLVRVEGGEEIVIARAGKPIAQLTAVTPPRDRSFGIMHLSVPESFFDHLPESELAAWE